VGGGGVRALKGSVYLNNPHSLQELKSNIQRSFTNISKWALSCVKKYFYKLEAS
jgi:hypothetical protein